MVAKSSSGVYVSAAFSAHCHLCASLSRCHGAKAQKQKGETTNIFLSLKPAYKLLEIQVTLVAKAAIGVEVYDGPAPPSHDEREVSKIVKRMGGAVQE